MKSLYISMFKYSSFLFYFKEFFTYISNCYLLFKFIIYGEYQKMLLDFFMFSLILEKSYN